MNGTVSDPIVAIVDDEQGILDFLCEVLKESNIKTRVFNNSLKALQSIRKNSFDLVITDFNMPGISGLQLLSAIKEQKEDLPVIIMTGCADREVAVSALNLHAFEMLLKPITIQPFIQAVGRGIEWSRSLREKKNLIDSLKQDYQSRNKELLSSIAKMDRMNREMLGHLSVAAEYRDNDTCKHINRVCSYVYCLARGLNFTASDARDLAQASSMHDIGKIGIGDAILFKQGPLTAEEFKAIQDHTVIGQRILQGSSFPILNRAASVALSHHERWDGSGYPQALKGEQIPLDSRIVILADIYDALRTERPYKRGLNHEEACNIIIDGDGRTLPEHFSPEVLNTFIRVAPRFNEISSELVNTHGDNKLFKSGFMKRIFKDSHLQPNKVERLQCGFLDMNQ